MALTESQRTQIVAMARNGTTRNDIARIIGCSSSTVSKWANRAGVRFDRTATENATVARQIDQRAKRTELNVGILTGLLEGMSRLSETTDPKSFQAFAQSIASLTRAHADLTRLDPPAPDESAEEVKMALSDFLKGATALADRFVADDTPETPPTQETP